MHHIKNLMYRIFEGVPLGVPHDDYPLVRNAHGPLQLDDVVFICRHPDSFTPGEKQLTGL